MEYAIYYRSDSGDITRLGHTLDDEARPLSTADRGDWDEERLAGWPERRVFWNNATGVAIGYAPIRGQ